MSTGPPFGSADGNPARPVGSPVDRPLRLGEVIAETIRLYGERVRPTLGLGAVTSGAFLLGYALHPVAGVLVVSVAFTAAYAVAARLVVGDRFSEAWAHVRLQLPLLLVLTLVVSLPFALALSQLYLLVFAVAWLAFSGFSIPVAMLERDAEARSWLSQLAFSLQRSITLARSEYLHAAGVAAALVLIYLLFGIVLSSLLAGVADNGGLAAAALTQVVLAPFFFLGLAVLYFDQRARAVSSPSRSAQTQ